MGAEGSIRLDAYIRERGAIPYVKATKIAEEVLAQLALLDARGDRRALSGISLSRIVISPNGQVVLLAPQDDLPVLVSAPGCAAPEEIRGGPADLRSAIYSLGCSLFEMITGRPPFLGNDARVLLRSHLATPAPDLAALRPDVPGGLATTLRAFLAKDPTQRPSTPAAAIGLLRAALGAPPPGPAVAAVRPAAAVRPVRAAPRAPAAARGVARGPAGPARRVGQPTSQGGTRATPASRTRFAAIPAAAAGSRGSTLRGGRTDAAGDHDEGWERSPSGARKWIFTWCGLGLGVFLSLLLAANEMMKLEAPKPARGAFTQAEKDQVNARRAQFLKSMADEDRLAERELQGSSLRVSYAERANRMASLLDRFAHTSSARQIAEDLTKWREAIAEGAVEEQSRAAEAAAVAEKAVPLPGALGSKAAPSGPPPSATPPPQPPPDPDGVPVDLGKEEGKEEL